MPNDPLTESVRLAKWFEIIEENECLTWVYKILGSIIFLKHEHFLFLAVYVLERMSLIAPKVLTRFSFCTKAHFSPCMTQSEFSQKYHLLLLTAY